MAATEMPAREASINSDAVSPGTYKLIPYDGTQPVFSGKVSFTQMRRLIGCDTLDTVTIDRLRQTVMSWMTRA